LGDTFARAKVKVSDSLGIQIAKFVDVTTEEFACLMTNGVNAAPICHIKFCKKKYNPKDANQQSIAIGARNEN